MPRLAVNGRPGRKFMCGFSSIHLFSRCRVPPHPKAGFCLRFAMPMLTSFGFRLCFAVALLTLNAFAQTTHQPVNETAYNAAVTAAVNGDSISLSNDITFTASPSALTKNLNFIGNGFSLKGLESGRVFTVSGATVSMTGIDVREDMIFENAATVNFSGGFGLGDNNPGSAIIRSGAKLIALGGPNPDIGVGSSGIVTVTGTGSEWSGGVYLSVGRQASGTLNILDGGRVSTSKTFVGVVSTGTATLSGATSTWVSSIGLLIGFQAGGNGTVTITGGGTATASQVEMANAATATGALYLNGTAGSRGTLATGYIIKGSGAATVDADGGLFRAQSGAVDLFQGFSAGDVTLGAGGLFVDTNGNNVSLSAILDGAGALTKEGTGTLTLSGSNTFGGGVTLKGGAVSITAASNLGSAGISMDGGALSTSTTMSVNRAASLVSGGTFTTTAGTLTWSGVISGSGTLAKNGTGTLILTGTNTFTGNATVSAGTLQVGSGAAGSIASNIVNNAAVSFNRSNALTYAGSISGTGTVTKAGSGTLTLSSASTYLGGTTVSAGTLAVSTTGGIGTGAASVSGTLRFESSASAGSRQITNNLGGQTRFIDSASAGSAAITNQSAGFTYFLDTSSAGSATINHNGTSFTSFEGTPTADNATLNLTSSDSFLDITGLTGTGISVGSLAGLGNVHLGSKILTVGGLNTSTTLSGVIDGTSGALAKAGTGTLTLTGANTYTGGTTVSAGTLHLASTSGSATGTGSVLVSTGATLSGTGTIAGSATLNSGARLSPGPSIATLTVNGSLAWNGSTDASAMLFYQLSTTDATSDRIAIGGAFTRGGGSTYSFDFGGTGQTGRTYTLATFASTDFSVGHFSYTNLASGLTGAFVLTATELQFVVGLPGTLAFSATDYPVAESVGTATITVNRTGGSVGAVTVAYATSNGTALSGSDYTAASGTLTFAHGVTTQTFSVSVADDALVEGSEALNLALSNPTGGASLGATSTATLTIADNDTAPAISSVTGPSAASYRAGQDLDFTVNYGVAVTVMGTPSLSLTVGAAPRSAAFVSGSGTTALLFRYTVAAGDTDTDGIASASPLVLNSGTIRDGVGNDADLAFTTPTTTAVLVDTTAPAAPVFTGITNDSGSSATDNITNDATLVLNGTAEPGSTVTVTRVSTGVLGTATANGSGVWSYDYTATTLGSGDHSFTATTADVAGNVSPVSGTFIVTVDTSVNAPVITAIGADTGSSTTDGVTSDATLTLFGTAEAGSTVTVNRAGVGALGTATANVGGLWSFDYTGTTLPDGSYLFSATATDTSGNASAASADFPVTIDTTAPVAPVIAAISTDSGNLTTDRVTNDTTLQLSGTAEANAVVTLSRTGTGVLGTATADGAGAWSYDYTGTTLPEGVHNFTATATDAAGNLGVASAAFAVTVDTTAPAITSASTATGTYGSAFATFTVTAPGAISFSATGLPGGLTIDSGTGTITGTPASAGSFPATLTVTDTAGNAGTGTLTITVAQKALTVAGLVANGKAYDGTTSVTVNTTGANLVGVQGGDTVTLNLSGLTAAFSDPAVGVGKTVIVSGLTLAGPDAGKYSLTQPTLTASIGKASQAILFSFGGAVPIGVPVAIQATATSGLPVTVEVVSGPGRLSGNLLTVTEPAPVRVRATQAGNVFYEATSLELVLATFAQSPQTIVFTPPVGARVGEPITLVATASSGLPVQYTLVSGNATLEGAVLTPRDATPLVVRATQPGNAVYFAATPVEIALNDIAKRPQTIAFAELANRRVNVAPFALAATASSGLPVSFTLVSGPATLSGSTLTLAGTPGNVVVRATQAGNAEYAEAPAVERTLVVTPVIAGRFVNLSARARAGVGTQTFITGFTIGGGVPKQLLMRAVGPGLSAFGVTGVLADPILQVSRGGLTVAENSNWSGDPALAAAAARVGAFPLSPTSPDAALLTTLNAGPYSTLVTGGTGSGVVLTEIYSADSAVGAADQHFVNFSVRAEASSGDAAMIVGFVVTGETPVNVLVRAIGPGLSVFGISPVLADPRVQLFQGSTVLAANNDLTAEAAAAAASVGAFALPAGSRDAALVFTLQPGIYTAILSGGETTPGVALLEVYELP